MRSIPRLKICCISSIEEAQIAIRGGAAAVGLVSDMPSGPGVISEPLIAEIARTIPPGIASFLLTSQQQVGEIIAQQRRCRTSVIQLCDRLTDGTYDDLREALPGISLVQVIHVTGPEALDEALAAAPQVNGLLLDSGNPTLEVKQLGGTGRTHNWEISREIRIRSQVPVFLAGGLNPDNVAEAVRMVEPFGVDVCSGVRTDGRLDEGKVESFVNSLLL